MYFSENVDSHLRSWLVHDSWESAHPMDEARFFSFVRVLVDESRFPAPLELKTSLKSALREYHPNIVLSKFEKDIDRFVADAQTIFVYEKSRFLLRQS